MLPTLSRLVKGKMNENEKPDGETLDFDKPAYKFEPGEQHDWRQQGPYLVCKSCELQHAVFIGMKKQLVGINDKGQPILEDWAKRKDV